MSRSEKKKITVEITVPALLDLTVYLSGEDGNESVEIDDANVSIIQHRIDPNSLGEYCNEADFEEIDQKAFEAFGKKKPT